jgi:hypothetical protein
VRSVAHQEPAAQRSSQNTPTPWDQQGTRERSAPSRAEDHDYVNRGSRGASNRDSRGSQRERIERLGFGQPQHTRNESGNASSTEFADTHPDPDTGRRHDYDMHSVDTDLSSPRAGAHKNIIPPPMVTVRSEFPTLNRSRQQQSLTCLVTIEVPEGKWHPTPNDLRRAPPPLPPPPEESYQPEKSLVAPSHSRKLSYETSKALEEITEDLKNRVDNWHGLEFNR